MKQILLLFLTANNLLTCFSQGNWIKVTNNTTEDFHASFSPDGKKILFDSEQSGINEVYLYDLTTRQTKQLTDNKTRSDHPTWFPDSKHILFNYWQDGPQRYIMNIEDTSRKLLFNNAYGIASEKGNKVSVITNINGDFDLYVINSDGQSPRQLTNFKGDETGMSWSPDDEYIAFMRELDNRLQVCKIAADGTGYQQLTFNDSSCLAAQWNPKSGLIAYTYMAGINSVLCVINEDGMAKKELATFKGEVANIVWSPDGKRIVFSMGNEEAEELAIITVNDGTLVRLTDNNFRDTYPSWSPDGKKILFVSEKDGDLDIYYMQL